VGGKKSVDRIRAREVRQIETIAEADRSDCLGWIATVAAAYSALALKKGNSEKTEIKWGFRKRDPGNRRDNSGRNGKLNRSLPKRARDAGIQEWSLEEVKGRRPK